MGRVIDRDLGYKRIIKDLKAFGDMTLEVGVFESAGKEADGTDLVDIAIYNEYGTKNIPARPFLRQASDNNMDKWYDLLTEYEGQIIEGRMTPERALERLGLRAVGDIQTEISEGDFKPNAPSTIKKKGSSRPLIDTGTLRTRGIDYRVNK